jgi:hypothetical protein
MFDFIWDLVEREQRPDLSAPWAPPSPQSVVAQAEAKVVTLEQRHERLRLTSMTIWELVKRKLGVTDTELATEIQALVAETGGRGRNVRGLRLTTCQSCHRNVLSSAMTCVYCGAKLAVTAGFGGT